jgi:hypothetical protein
MLFAPFKVNITRAVGGLPVQDRVSQPALLRLRDYEVGITPGLWQDETAERPDVLPLARPGSVIGSRLMKSLHRRCLLLLALALALFAISLPSLALIMPPAVPTIRPGMTSGEVDTEMVQHGFQREYLCEQLRRQKIPYNNEAWLSRTDKAQILIFYDNQVGLGGGGKVVGVYRNDSGLFYQLRRMANKMGL